MAPSYRRVRHADPARDVFPNDPDVKYPFASDRAAMAAFLHGQLWPGTVLLSVYAPGAQDFPPVLRVRMSGSVERDVAGPNDAIIASYAADGALVFTMPESPLVRAYARSAWNWMLEALAEPNDRRVTQVWRSEPTPPGASGPSASRGSRSEYEAWPVAHWMFDGVEMPLDKPIYVAGRLTLAAWRAANPPISVSILP